MTCFQPLTKIGAIACSTIALSFTGCKVDRGSSTKSFVGLEADINADVAKGQAPSFLLLQQWFNGEIPVDEAAAQYGKVSYKVHQSFSDYTYGQIPAQYRDGLVKYYQQQIDRVNAFQQAKANPQALTALLNVEAAEMYDILRTLLEVNYKPQTNDLLAHLISQPGLRNFIDRFSVELLSRLYKRPLRDLIANLGAERDNFAKLLVTTYVTPSGANPKFQKDLATDCAKLINFITALGAQPIKNCTAASGFQLSSGGDLNSAAAGLTGGGQKFANAYAGIFAAGGPVQASGAAPQLSIFQGKDPAAGDGGAAPGGVTPVTPATPTPTIAPPAGGLGGGTQPPGLAGTLTQLLGPNWASNIPSLSTQADDESLALNSPVTASTLPPKPKFDCLKTPANTGLPLVLCQRYGAVLPSTKELGLKTNSVAKSKTSNSGNSFGLAQGYNYFIVYKYHTPIQDQGQDGACTAFGLTHTVEANLQKISPGATFDSWTQWSEQSQQPNVGIAISTARGRDFGGHRIVDDVTLTTVDTIKAAMDQGHAVYSASEVDDSWTTMYSPGTSLSCGNPAGESGHAYSLQGYDDTKQVFILKNSWGDSWGESGYGYLPYSCITTFQQGEWHDLIMQ